MQKEDAREVKIKLECVILEFLVPYYVFKPQELAHSLKKIKSYHISNRSTE